MATKKLGLGFVPRHLSLASLYIEQQPAREPRSRAGCRRHAASGSEHGAGPAKATPAFLGVYRDGLEQRLRTGAAAADVKKNWGTWRPIHHARGNLCYHSWGLESISLPAEECPTAAHEGSFRWSFGVWSKNYDDHENKAAPRVVTSVTTESPSTCRSGAADGGLESRAERSVSGPWDRSSGLSPSGADVAPAKE